MQTKTICQRCLGNGYIKVKKSVDDPKDIIEQCPMCHSQGEIMIDRQRMNSIKTERLLLESKLVKELNGMIKKLNDEVDMLTKQKIYLQSKLREKEKTDDQRR
jgi:hypothetical protein